MDTPIIAGKAYDSEDLVSGEAALAERVRASSIPDSYKNHVYNDLLRAARGMAGLSSTIVDRALDVRITAFKRVIDEISKTVDLSVDPNTDFLGSEISKAQLLGKVVTLVATVPLRDQQTAGLLRPDLKGILEDALGVDENYFFLGRDIDERKQRASASSRETEDLVFSSLARRVRDPPRRGREKILFEALNATGTMTDYQALLDNPDRITADSVTALINKLVVNDPMRYDRVIRDKWSLLSQIHGIAQGMSSADMKRDFVSQNVIRNLIEDVKGLSPGILQQLQRDPGNANNMLTFRISLAANYDLAVQALIREANAMATGLMSAASAKRGTFTPSSYYHRHVYTKQSTVLGASKHLFHLTFDVKPLKPKHKAPALADPSGSDDPDEDTERKPISTIGVLAEAGFTAMTAQPNHDLRLVIASNLSTFPKALQPRLLIFETQLQSSQNSAMTWNAGIAGGIKRILKCVEVQRKTRPLPPSFYDIYGFMSTMEVPAKDTTYYKSLQGVFHCRPSDLRQFMTLTAVFPERPVGIFPDFNRSASAPFPFKKYKMGDTLKNTDGEITDTVYMQFMRIADSVITTIRQQRLRGKTTAQMEKTIMEENPEAFYNKAILKLESYKLNKPWEMTEDVASTQTKMRDYQASWIKANKMSEKGRCIWIGTSMSPYANMVFGALFESSSSFVSDPSMSFHHLYASPGIKNLLGYSIADGNYDMILGWLLLRPDSRDFKTQTAEDQKASSPASSSSSTDGDYPFDEHKPYRWEDFIPHEQLTRAAIYSDNIFLSSWCTDTLTPEDFDVCEDVADAKSLFDQYKETGSVTLDGFVMASFDMEKAESQIPKLMFDGILDFYIDHFAIDGDVATLWRMILSKTVGWTDSILGKMVVKIKMMFSGTRWTTILNTAFTWHVLQNTRKMFGQATVSNLLRYCKLNSIQIKLTNLLFVTRRSDIYRFDRFDYNWGDRKTAIRIARAGVVGVKTDFLGFNTAVESLPDNYKCNVRPSTRYREGPRQQKFRGFRLRPMAFIFVGSLMAKRLYPMLSWTKSAAYPSAETEEERIKRETTGLRVKTKPKTRAQINAAKLQSYVSALYLGARLYPEMSAALVTAISSQSTSLELEGETVYVEGESGDSSVSITSEEMNKLREAVLTGQVTTAANALWFYHDSYTQNERFIPPPFPYTLDLQPPAINRRFTTSVAQYLKSHRVSLQHLVAPYKTPEATPTVFSEDRISVVIEEFARTYNYQLTPLLRDHFKYVLEQLAKIYLRPFSHKGKLIYPDNRLSFEVPDIEKEDDELFRDFLGRSDDVEPDPGDTAADDEPVESFVDEAAVPAAAEPEVLSAKRPRAPSPPADVKTAPASLTSTNPPPKRITQDLYDVLDAELGEEDEYPSYQPEEKVPVPVLPWLRGSATTKRARESDSPGSPVAQPPAKITRRDQ
jgi:hypothetical protein